MPVRLKDELLEQKPKTVHRLPTWLTPVHVTPASEQAEMVSRIIRAIENGTPLPTGFYRKGLGLSPDGLLAAHGIMHLHLGKPNTKELLYLVQYPDDVVLLELSGHGHFTSRPVGRALLAAHKEALAALEAKLDAKPKPVTPPQTVRKVRKGPIPTKPAAPKNPKPNPSKPA